VLSRLRLLLPDGAEDGHQGNEHEHEVLVPNPELKLAESLEENHGLNVTNSPANLNEADIGLLVRPVNRNLRHPLDPVLNLVGNVRNNLDRMPR